jgi:hypothetical protein
MSLKDAVDCLRPRERAVIFLSLWTFSFSILVDGWMVDSSILGRVMPGLPGREVGLIHWSARDWRER